jgi:hypothetical protein
VIVEKEMSHSAWKPAGAVMLTFVGGGGDIPLQAVDVNSIFAELNYPEDPQQHHRRNTIFHTQQDSSFNGHSRRFNLRPLNLIHQL